MKNGEIAKSDHASLAAGDGNQIKTVIRVYWVAPDEVLESNGLEVVLYEDHSGHRRR